MNEKRLNQVSIYPLSWFYNAGVIGFARLFELDQVFTDDGRVVFDLDDLIKKNDNAKDILMKWKNLHLDKYSSYVKKIYGYGDNNKDKYVDIINEKIINRIIGRQFSYYANQTVDSIERSIERFLKSCVGKESPVRCSFCAGKRDVDLVEMSQKFGNVLFGSEKSCFNVFWDCDNNVYVCSLCELILRCHLLGMVLLADGSELFVNSSSLKATREFNFQVESAHSTQGVKVLGIGEIVSKLLMNKKFISSSDKGIEVVMWAGLFSDKDKDLSGSLNICHVSSELARLLADDDVARCIKRINERFVYDIVLNQDYAGLFDEGCRKFRTAVVSEGKKDPLFMSELIFELYAVVKDKLEDIRSYEYE